MAKGVALFPEGIKELGQGGEASSSWPMTQNLTQTLMGGNTVLHLACANSNNVMVVRELIHRYRDACLVTNDRGDFLDLDRPVKQVLSLNLNLNPLPGRRPPRALCSDESQ